MAKVDALTEDQFLDFQMDVLQQLKNAALPTAAPQGWPTRSSSPLSNQTCSNTGRDETSHDSSSRSSSRDAATQGSGLTKDSQRYKA
ncbi:hypothetical protein ScPMuIL_015115 [Solemya velum]